MPLTNAGMLSVIGAATRPCADRVRGAAPAIKRSPRPMNAAAAVATEAQALAELKALAGKSFRCSRASSARATTVPTRRT